MAVCKPYREYISDFSYYDYDENNNIAHYHNDEEQYDEWSNYDDEGNPIHTWDSDGGSVWYEYDSENRCIHFKDDIVTYEFWREYDGKSNVINHRDSNGFSRHYEYDIHNNLVHTVDSDKSEVWRYYDNHNRVIHVKTSLGNEKWYKYDKVTGKCIWQKEYDGYGQYYIYDKKERTVTYTNSYGASKVIDLDKSTRIVLSHQYTEL